jgi:hypothetical protein
MKHQFFLFVIGITLLLFGLIIRYSVGRRRFNRRNPVGLQQFQSYNQAVITRAGEWCARAIGTMLIVAGILLSLAGVA